MAFKTCVLPSGEFIFGIHRPSYNVTNLRCNDYPNDLGRDLDGNSVDNGINNPSGDISVEEADWVFEIHNPFPFKGATYIARRWAEARAADISRIRLPEASPASMHKTVQEWQEFQDKSFRGAESVIRSLPRPLQLALAVTSTDADDLICLAKLSCDFVFDADGGPEGLSFRTLPDGRRLPVINDEELFEALVNNLHLPDVYKEVMVLRPGIQGSSEIVGDWRGEDGRTHVFEYLRQNSYIPWGHFAANMANTSIRYDVQDLSNYEMRGMRHLYYQRIYTQIGRELSCCHHDGRGTLSDEQLESLRRDIISFLEKENPVNSFKNTLWGWNYGFDFSPAGYRLHASHQQIHQQYALVPGSVSSSGAGVERIQTEENYRPFACGDMIEDFIVEYEKVHGVPFFEAYLKAIQANRRVDGREDRRQSLIVYQDDRVILFVPKAQTSQWELQLMTLQPVGNVLEANSETRKSLDLGIYKAVSVLAALGAKMITSIEYSKRFDLKGIDQRLLYVFLPKIPYSMGGFSEAQSRWINGHYPEDFAAACRKSLRALSKE